MIADEIQSGLGRTGKWFAYQHYGIQPDITTVAKPIANGIPMGAMLCTEATAQAFSPGMHGTTFGGGPLACAAALAVLETVENTGLLAHVTETGAYFKQELEQLAGKHYCIVEVRGEGLMLGVELDSAKLAADVVTAMMARRIILNRTSETVLRFLPPFILERAHVEIAVEALDAVLTQLTQSQLQHDTAALQGEHAHG